MMNQVGTARLGKWGDASPHLSKVLGDVFPKNEEKKLPWAHHPAVGLVRSLAQRARLLFEKKWVAWAVLFLTLLLTLILWRHAESELVHRQDQQFHRAAEKQTLILVSRMRDYEQVLRGGAALFQARGVPTREEWRIYVERLQLERSLPGILGTGFTVMVPREARDAHEREVRAQGFPRYMIYPPGNRPLFSSIVYLEPFTGRNLRAFGYDMFSDPVRREAMTRARDTGEPALTGKVTLVQETTAQVQPGFALYVPVYQNGMPHDTVSERRRALLGFVYSPFRSFDLLDDLMRRSSQDVEVELFDRKAVPENLFYSSLDAPREARHVADIPVEIGGRTWLARIHSSPEFEANTNSNQPDMILYGGLALDLMLFAVLYINARFRRKMRESAARLQLSLDTFRTLVENIPGAVYRAEVGASPPVLQLSAGIRSLTGEFPERFLSGDIFYTQFIHPDDKPGVCEAIAEAIAKRGPYSMEYRIKSSDGYTRWVSERGRVTPDESGQARWLDGLILDITERKAAEIMIRDLAFNDTLTGLPNRRLLLDRLEHQLAASDRTGRCGALLFIDMDNFKSINDTLGHEAGDQVLMEVARRLLSSVRESDTVARLGGDEFVVVLDNLDAANGAACAEAEELGNKILSILSEPYKLGEHVRTSTPSIGVTTFCGNQASAAKLLRHADQAMYRAKSSGRNQLQFYDAQSTGTLPCK